MTIDFEKRHADLILQDVSKLHSEINQAVNHRFLLTAGAITAFALISKNIVHLPEEHDSALSFLVNIVSYFAYLSVLALLFYQSLGIRVIIRTNSTYLRAKRYSDWEEEWFHFRSENKKYNGVLSNADLIAHGSIFVGLSLLTLVLGTYLICALYGERELVIYKNVAGLVFIMLLTTSLIYIISHTVKYAFGKLIGKILASAFPRFVASAAISFCLSATYLYAGICLIRKYFYDIERFSEYPIFALIFVGVYVNIWLVCWFVLRIYKPAYDEKDLLIKWREVL